MSLLIAFTHRECVDDGLFGEEVLRRIVQDSAQWIVGASWHIMFTCM